MAKKTAPLRMMGTGAPAGSRKFNMMGMWFLAAKIDLIPGAGEIVCNLPTAPPVAIAYTQAGCAGSAISSAQLMNISGNRYECTISCGALEPFSVRYKFRFIAAEQTACENL